MTKKDLIIVGIKLMGIYIVVFGIFSLIPKGVTMLHYLIAFPGLAPSSASPDSQELMMKYAMKQGFVSTSTQMLWAIIRILIGLYFCKRGELVIKFLLGKRSINTPTNS